MAGRVEAIYRLQLTDTEIEEKRNALRAIERQLADEEDVLAARAAVHGSEETLQKSLGRLRGLEMDLEEIVAKIASAEKGLYGGEVTNPKELAGMEQELQYLRRRRSVVEDDTLSMMAEVEEQREALRIAGEKLAGVEQHWQALQAELEQDAEEARSRIASLEDERKEIAERIPDKDLAAYESLCRQKGGQAVALLENGVCQGCRVTLPTSQAQRVRRGSELVFCGSCQRILHVAR